MTVQCCMCEKVRERNGEWISQAPEAPNTVSHTYCPACRSEAKAALKHQREVFAGVNPASAVA